MKTEEEGQVRYVVPAAITTVAELEKRIAESCAEFQINSGEFVDRIELNPFIEDNVIMFRDNQVPVDLFRKIKVTLVLARKKFKP